MSSDQSLYDSPADGDCQKNYIVYLDGRPAAERRDSNATIQRTAGIRDVNGYATSCDRRCQRWPVTAMEPASALDELAKWMNESDMPARTGRAYRTSPATGSASAGRGRRYGLPAARSPSAVAASITRPLTRPNSARPFTKILGADPRNRTTIIHRADSRRQRVQPHAEPQLPLHVAVQAARCLTGGSATSRSTASPLTGSILDANGNAAVDPNTGFFE